MSEPTAAGCETAATAVVDRPAPAARPGRSDRSGRSGRAGRPGLPSRTGWSGRPAADWWRAGRALAGAGLSLLTAVAFAPAFGRTSVEALADPRYAGTITGAVAAVAAACV